ncbi:hypothetical protein Dimus_000844 [Dionaea muscipula]
MAALLQTISWVAISWVAWETASCRWLTSTEGVEGYCLAEILSFYAEFISLSSLSLYLCSLLLNAGCNGGGGVEGLKLYCIAAVAKTDKSLTRRLLRCRLKKNPRAEAFTEEEMAKSKNHTAHNQSYKAHKNGIKKPRKHRNQSTKGMDPKFLRNQRYARKHNKKPGEESSAEE